MLVLVHVLEREIASLAFAPSRLRSVPLAKTEGIKGSMSCAEGARLGLAIRARQGVRSPPQEAREAAARAAEERCGTAELARAKTRPPRNLAQSVGQGLKT